MSRRWILWALDPVKYPQAAPKALGSTTNIRLDALPGHHTRLRLPMGENLADQGKGDEGVHDLARSGRDGQDVDVSDSVLHSPDATRAFDPGHSLDLPEAGDDLPDQGEGEAERHAPRGTLEHLNASKDILFGLGLDPRKAPKFTGAGGRLESRDAIDPLPLIR